MSATPAIQWENLKLKEPLTDDAFKSIAVVYPLKLQGELSTKTLAITDKGLELVPHTQEEWTLSVFGAFLKASWNIPLDAHFVLNNFDAPRKEKWGFELDERVHVLCIAIRILTANRCLRKATFHFNDTTDPITYYSPFVSRDSIGGILSEEASVISTNAEFEILQEIYNQLLALEVFKYDDRFSKLINTIRFYDRFEDTGWFLQKIVHAFVGLESLFTDTSKSEMTYKVSIRTAYFLYPDDATARRELFDLLKIAYDVRSSFLHGSRVDEAALTRKLQELKANDKYSLWFDLPADLNKILSAALRKILCNADELAFFSGNPNQKKEAEFYSALVLGK